MTALTAGRAIKQMAGNPVPDLVSKPIADNVHIYNGAMVMGDANDRVVPAAPGSGVTAGHKVIGVADGDYDNTVAGHTAGAFNVRIKQGCFKFNNSTAGEALAAADVGKLCYAADDNVVQKDSSTSTAPIAGTVVMVETTGVWVQTVWFTGL